MRLRYQKYSFRFAEQILNSKLALKEEIENVLQDPAIDFHDLSRPVFKSLLEKLFVEIGWESQPAIFDDPGDPAARLDFLKDRIGIEVGFDSSYLLGTDLLKFQVSANSGLDKIDIGVYIVTTKEFQKIMHTDYNQNWDGCLQYEKVIKYLNHFKNAIHVPIYVLGLDL